MNTRRGTRSTKGGNSVGSSHNEASRERLDTEITVRTIEQALSELGIQAPLSDIVARAQLIENRIIQSRSRRKPEHMC